MNREYDFLSTDAILEEALSNEREGVDRFAIVTAGLTSDGTTVLGADAASAIAELPFGRDSIVVRKYYFQYFIIGKY